MRRTARFNFVSELFFLDEGSAKTLAVLDADESTNAVRSEGKPRGASGTTTINGSVWGTVKSTEITKDTSTAAGRGIFSYTSSPTFSY